MCTLFFLSFRKRQGYEVRTKKSGERSMKREVSEREKSVAKERNKETFILSHYEERLRKNYCGYDYADDSLLKNLLKPVGMKSHEHTVIFCGGQERSNFVERAYAHSSPYVCVITEEVITNLPKLSPSVAIEERMFANESAYAEERKRRTCGRFEALSAQEHERSNDK